MIRSILTAIAGLLAQPATVLAPLTPGQHQFGNVVFTLPEGWNLGRDTGGIQVITSDLPDDLCGYCYIYVSAGFPAGGSLTDFLIAHQSQFADDADAAASVELMSPPDLLAFSGHPAAMMGITIGSDFQVLVAYDLGDRYELLAFEGYGYDQDALNEGIGVFSESVSPMFDSLQFVSAGGQSLLPAPMPGSLSGMYWGTSLEQSFGLDMMIRYDLAQHRFFFWPDGQFYDGSPPMGLLPLDRMRLLSTADPDFGVYRQQGSQVLLTYATGKTLTLTMSGADLTYDDLTLSLTPLLADGSRFSGTISSFYYSGFTPGAGVEGGVSFWSETTFYQDGSYTGSSFGGAFGSFDQGGGFTSSSDGATGGQYEVRDGLIISTPADGSSARAALIFNTSQGMVIGDRSLE